MSRRSNRKKFGALVIALLLLPHTFSVPSGSDMASTIFLPLDAQQAIILAQHIQFSVVAILTVIAFYCLFTKTAPQQSSIRNYIIWIQALLFLSDTFVDCLWLPIGVFPAPAGYCSGILCSTGLMSMKMGAVIFMFLASNIGVLILLCCLQRHQAILLGSNPFKFSSPILLLLRVVLVAIFNSQWIFYFIAPTTNAERLIDEFRPDITWIRQRGAYHFEEASGTAIQALFYVSIVNLVLSNILTDLLFGHMFYFLHSETDKQSKARIDAIRKSLFILFAQLFVPMSLVVLPLLVVFFALIVPDLCSFELLAAMMYITTLHPLGHTILLLGLTPAYRQFLVSLLLCRARIPLIMKVSGMSLNPKTTGGK